MDEILQNLASSGKTTAMNMIGRAQKFFDSLSDEEHTSIFKVQGLQPFNGLWTVGSMIASGAAMLFLRYTLPHKPAGSCVYLERVTKDTFSKPFVSADCQIYQGSEILGEIIFLAFPFIAVLIIEVIECKSKLKKNVHTQSKSMMHHLSKFKDNVRKIRSKVRSSSEYTVSPIDPERSIRAQIFEETVSTVDTMLKSTQLNLYEISNSFKSHFADGLIQAFGIGGLIALMISFKFMIADKDTQFQCPVHMPTGELMTMSCIYPSVRYTKFEVNLVLFGCLPAVCIVFVVSMFTGWAEIAKRDNKLCEYSERLHKLVEMCEEIKDLEAVTVIEFLDDQFFDELGANLEIFERTTEVDFDTFEAKVSKFLDELNEFLDD